jgi:hypothetical protein
MLRNLAWQKTDELTRAQFAVFEAVSDQVNLTTEDRRLALGLSKAAWRAWTDFLADGPLPAEPPVPEMILRLGQAAYAASVMAEMLDGQGA